MDREDTKVDDFLRRYAKEYHNIDFIKSDPVQFPHRYKLKQDIEISGFLTAYISFGSRVQILKFAEKLDLIMGRAPLKYVLSEKWRDDFKGADSFYRTISKDKMNELFALLYSVYSQYDDMEKALQQYEGTPMFRMCKLMNVTSKSPQKKVNMFLRWMIRDNSDVDFGIWNSFSSADLIIPLDVHVSEISFRLGLTKSKSYSLSNAKMITNRLSEIFPGDPCLGDFALFGYGVNEEK